jgi:peptide/nickel transport system substrate-binding protein
MKQHLCAFAAIVPLVGMSAGQAAFAEKPGGVLKLYSPASPASMSLLEEVTIVAEMPMMGVFNNLILFDQHVPQVSLQSIVPELATRWSWNEEANELTVNLRQGVKWHDGKPFTAQDVKCTYDLRMDRAPEKLRVNPGKSSLGNLDRVTTNGDFEVTFHLKRPQPAFPMLLVGGFSVIFPCHVPPHEMRTHPIGTGPFKFGEFKPNEDIRVIRNPDYWKRIGLISTEWSIRSSAIRPQRH